MKRNITLLSVLSLYLFAFAANSAIAESRMPSSYQMPLELQDAAVFAGMGIPYFK